MSPLDNVRILEFPGVIEPSRGSLTVIENIKYETFLPSGRITTETFPVKRVFYIYDVPSDAERGGHAHHTTLEILICLSGSFDITLTDGFKSKSFHLDNPNSGLLIPVDVWNRMTSFSPDTIVLVLCSEPYRPEGYTHNLEEYKDFILKKYLS